MTFKIGLYIFVITCLQGKIVCQPIKDSTLNKKKLAIFTASIGVAYTGSLITLGQLWYKKEPQSSFHFFNDNDEWLQMDKAGHATTSFNESCFIIESLKWTGLSKKKAILYGSFAGLIFQTPIEVLDGFSSAYGASWGDEMANAIGSIGVFTQYTFWDEIRIKPKYSFHPTSFAHIRPNELGSSFAEEWLKDYNGQTYWVSINMWSMAKRSKIPKWINLSIGYGGENMLYAKLKDNNAHGYNSYRQYYLSFDIDFSKLRIKNKWIRLITYPFNFIHIPFPALEYNSHHGFKFDGFYF